MRRTRIISQWVFGLFFCGWICPMGSMLDLFGRRSRNRSPAPGGKYYRIR